MGGGPHGTVALALNNPQRLLTTGLGHTSAGCVSWYTDQVWCILILVTVSRGHMTSDSGKLGFMSRVLRPASLEFQGVVPQTLIPSGGARFIAWRMRRLFLGECWRGLKPFWNYGLTPGSHKKEKKGHVPYSCLCGALDKYQVDISLNKETQKKTRKKYLYERTVFTIFG